MSPAAEGILERLDAARQKWWLFTLLSTTAIAVCASSAALLLFMLCDAALRLPRAGLAALFSAWIGLTAALIVIVSRRLLRGQRTLEGTARRVEAEFPEIGSDLINIVQLAEDAKNANRAFCEAAVNQAAARIALVRFDEAAECESRWRRFRDCMQTPRDLLEWIGALTVLAIVAILCQVYVPNWNSAFERLLSPWRFVPSVGTSGQIRVTPQDKEVLLGSSVEIAGEIKNPAAEPKRATLFLVWQGEEETSLPMQGDGGQQRFTLSVSSINKPFAYRLEIGDSQTPVYKISVQEKPAIQEARITYHYPEYMGRKPDTVTQKTVDLDSPQYTKADLWLTASAPLSQGRLQLGGATYTGTVEEQGKALSIRGVPMNKDGTFVVFLTTTGGLTDSDPRANLIRVTPDRPPVVEILKPGRESVSSPGTRLPVVVRAGDDYGLDRLKLELKVVDAPDAGDDNGGKAERAVTAEISPWHDVDGATAAVRRYELALDAAALEADKTVKVKAGQKLAFRAGQSVMLRAAAWDGRRGDFGDVLQPQSASSAWHVIRLVSGEAKAAATLEQLESLRNNLWRLLEKQMRARVKASLIGRAADVAGRSELSAAVRTQQVEIEQAAQAIVKSLSDDAKDERLAIKRAVHKLACDEMAEAIGHCDRLAKAAALEDFDAPAYDLTYAQDRIIDVLRRLLDTARDAENAALAEMKKRPGADLPDDAKKKFEEARDKLDEFLKQQKKIIEASENLAKKAVEDFTEADQQGLREMAAREDDWSKFMTELQTDLSKLPEQDFANASLLKELVEIQTELKMAEDALLKKSADIAVPLEQLGYERAEEITSNLEKWLTDTPDREKWSQEESLTDQDKEAPMAELPGELEDIIGGLMENEEDLFDEMEDVTSSAADSLDKGAGWDAMDGPISNMSAKGVTGNRLPNSSEIGGRSGEGRSGKSSGEFVGDEAVGKGGRKTPSRLTPDAYVKGQIKDHEKDGGGGASGGGKESGQGGEGLEGPAPGDRGPRDLQRLAGKQAALRNKAEGIDARMQVLNYHHTDLRKMIEVMAQVERDLRSGRYQNALRERKTLLQGLGNVKQYVEGEFVVKQDETTNLPTDIQKEILGGRQDPSPAGWEEMNREYFERLSQGGGSASKEGESK